MWCGPMAIAKLTGWTADDVWLHIRWLKERRGERLPDIPRGGTLLSDNISALNRAGFVVELVFARKRMRYDKFVEEYGAGGRWLLYQRRHFFARLQNQPINNPSAIIVAAYRVLKRDS